MTANLLAYQRNVEEARHNAEMERLQQEGVSVSAQQAQAALTNAGANALQAQVASARASEEARHNKAVEWYNTQRVWVDAADTAIDAAKVAATFMS